MFRVGGPSYFVYFPNSFAKTITSGIFVTPSINSRNQPVQRDTAILSKSRQAPFLPEFGVTRSATFSACLPKTSEPEPDGLPGSLFKRAFYFFRVSGLKLRRERITVGDSGYDFRLSITDEAPSHSVKVCCSLLSHTRAPFLLIRNPWLDCRACPYTSMRDDACSVLLGKHRLQIT